MYVLKGVTNMNRFFNRALSLALLLVLLFNLSCTSGARPQQEEPLISPQQNQLQQPTQNWTGDGGRGMSITIIDPRPIGLTENENHLPLLVQREFVSSFSNFSAIEVLDYERLPDLYDVLLSGYFDEDAGMDLGHLTTTTHIMSGSITRTATGYALHMNITRNADKMTTASYSDTFTFEELDNLTGIRRASSELLRRMGVTLTATAQAELTRVATTNQMIGRTAQARGITEQRHGAEAGALTFYSMAAAFDPTLLDAVNRYSILHANISSGNMGDDIREDIEWRRRWVERLTETEQFFNSFHRTESMPYTLFYVFDDIRRGAINYRDETVPLSIETHLHGSCIWTISIERALQAVYDGLHATGKASDWGLANWPRQGVTNLNAFARRSNNFSVVFELLNNRNTVIGRQTLQSSGFWELNWSGRPVINVHASDRRTLNFQNVSANDITNNLTIRAVSVNGQDAEIASRNRVLQIRAITRNEFNRNNSYRFAKGEIQGFTNHTTNAGALFIPDTIWGDPVISIGQAAFRNTGLTSVTISDGVTSVGANAFEHNQLTSVTFGSTATSVGLNAFANNRGHSGGFEVALTDHGRSLTIINYTGNHNGQIPSQINGMPVTRIGERAFANKQLTSVSIPNGVTIIDEMAFGDNRLTSITIGENVVMARNSFGITDNFRYFYTQSGRIAGTYTLGPTDWIAPGEDVARTTRNQNIRSRNQNIRSWVMLGLLAAGAIGGIYLLSLMSDPL
jgi:hypothetical protein